MGKRLSVTDIDRIYVLRKEGHSINEISSSLSIPKTTVLNHVQGIEILPPFDKILQNKRASAVQKKLRDVKAANDQAKVAVSTLSNRDLLLFTAALYWAEGSKRDFSLINSDPNLIKVFLFVVRDILKVGNEDIQISLRLFEDLDCEKCKVFWSETTVIPIDDFLAVHYLEGKKKGKLIHGMCRVRIKKGAYLLKFMDALKQEIVCNLPL